MIRGDVDKALHVSPFMAHGPPLHAGARPRRGDPVGAHREQRGGPLAFDATLGAASARAAHARSLARGPLRHPAAALRMLALIYGHALGLKLKGVPVHPHPARSAVMIDRLARRIAERLLSRLRAGRLTVVEDGLRRSSARGARGPRAHPLPARVAQLLRGSRGLAESYIDGLWDPPDLTAVIRVAARNVPAIDRLRRRLTLVRAPFQQLRALPVLRNTRRRGAAGPSPRTTTSATTSSS